MFRSKQSVKDEPAMTSSLTSGKASIVRKPISSSDPSSPSSPSSYMNKGSGDYFSEPSRTDGGSGNQALQRENSQSSLGSGLVSISMSSDNGSHSANVSEEAFEVVDLQADPSAHPQYNYNKNLPDAPTPAQNNQDVTVESMTAALAAAVQMSTNPAKSLSSLSLGHASIIPSAASTPEPRPSVRTSRLFSFSGKRSESSPNLGESASTPTSASPQASSPESAGATPTSRFALFARRPSNNVPTLETKNEEPEDENGMKELEYRGITVKEVRLKRGIRQSLLKHFLRWDLLID
jgi:hypothetical protein